MAEEKGKSSTKSSWYTINKSLLPLKAFYFFSVAAIGALLPFISLYMKQVGLTSAETGLIYGVMPFIGFLVRPVFGFISDRFKKHKLVLVICCVMTGVFYVVLLYIPSSQVEHTTVRTGIHCSQFNSYIHDCYHVNKSESCPLSFDGYANFSTVTSVKENFLSIVSLDNENVTGSYTHENEILQTRSDLSCEVSCQNKPKNGQNPTVCFTNSVERMNKNCFGMSVSLEEEIDLIFTLRNISNIIKREVVKDQQTSGDLVCRDFDLKSVTYKTDSYWQMLCSEDLEMECSMQCTPFKDKPCYETKTVATGMTIGLFFFFFLIGNIFFAPIISIGDAMVYDMLGERRHLFGKQRLWGTIGFALFAVTSSIIMDRMSMDPHTADFSVSFWIFLALFLITSLCTYFMPISENLLCSSNMKDMCKVLSHINVAVFMMVVLYFGLLTGVIETFLYWFLSEMADYHPLIPGLCLLVSCTAETPMLFYSGYIIKKVGHLNCLYMVFCAYFLRFLFYSFLTSAWYVLPIEILHSFTFGMMWATSTSYASMIAPPGMSATTQGLLGGVHFGFGKGIGSIVTGLLRVPLGFVWIFRLYSFLTVGLVVFYIAINRLCLKYAPQASKKKATHDNNEESTPVSVDNSAAEAAQNLLSDCEKQEIEKMDMDAVEK